MCCRSEHWKPFSSALHTRASVVIQCFPLKPFSISATHKMNGIVWNAFHYFTCHNFPSLFYFHSLNFVPQPLLPCSCHFSQLFLKMPFSMPLHVLSLQPIIFLLWRNPACLSKPSPNVTSLVKPSLKSLYVVITFRDVQLLHFGQTSITVFKILLSNYLCICPILPIVNSSRRGLCPFLTFMFPIWFQPQ